jgi:hypothetical protein
MDKWRKCTWTSELLIIRFVEVKVMLADSTLRADEKDASRVTN